MHASLPLRTGRVLSRVRVGRAVRALGLDARPYACFTCRLVAVPRIRRAIACGARRKSPAPHSASVSHQGGATGSARLTGRAVPSLRSEPLTSVGRLQRRTARLDHAAHRTGVDVLAEGRHVPLARRTAARACTSARPCAARALLRSKRTSSWSVPASRRRQYALATSVNFCPEKELTVKTRPVTCGGRLPRWTVIDLVVAAALAGEVVAGVLHDAVEDGQLAEVAGVDLLAVGVVGDDGGVQVDLLARRPARKAGSQPRPIFTLSASGGRPW